MEQVFASWSTGLLVLIPFVLIFSLAFAEIRKKLRKQAEVAALNATLESLKKSIIVVSEATVPGKHIEHDFGEIEAAGTAGPGYFRAAEKKALMLLMLKARDLGANGIVELHRLPLTEESALQWPVRSVRMAGRAVTVRKMKRYEKRAERVSRSSSEGTNGLL